MCSLGSNWQYVSIGSDNGLAPSRWQAIIWTNADPVHQRICAALGGDELTFPDIGAEIPKSNYYISVFP